MTKCVLKSDRREEPRIETSDVIRWKRPGRPEDNTAWTVDRSQSGLGFMITADVTPHVGDVLNVRRLDQDRWETINQTVRVVHATRASCDQLVMIGCRLG